MEDAGLYASHNAMQRQGTEAAIRAHWHRMKWARGGEGERALDVGCGTGDVTALLLLPAMPPNSTIVGIDKSSKMVAYAKSNYETENVNFKLVDFSIKNITTTLKAKSFSKIFSFYCFHWIADQHQAARNMSALLREGGEFLIVTAPTSQVFRIYRTLAQTDRWKPYMHDVECFVPCFNDSLDICGEIQKALESAGLEVATCDVTTTKAAFPSTRALMTALEAIDPFVRRMPDAVRKEYMACFESVCITFWPQNGATIYHYPIVVIRGSKPSAVPA